MPSKDPPLAKALADLDNALKGASPEVTKSLRRGASATQVAKLEKVVGRLGAELHTWFAWHEGQEGGTIGPSASDRLLTLRDAADAWKFLEREARKPWKATWVPLMSNGAGDYVVYDRGAGLLLRYLHDDAKRPKAAASLAAWAASVAGEWKRVAASTKPVAAPDGWTRVKIPSKQALAKKPAGTALYFRATSNIGKGIFFHLFWKKAPNEWFTATNSRLENAWTSIANNLLPFQALPDGGAANHVSEDEVMRDGDAAEHVGLYEQHFAEPPFPKR